MTALPVKRSTPLAAYPAAQPDLSGRVDLVRLRAGAEIAPARRAELGQFMTPAPIARFMAELVRADASALRVLDAGAGVGSLSAELVEDLLARDRRPESLRVDAWEIDPPLARHLRATLSECAACCAASRVGFDASVHQEDFVAAGVSMLDGSLFARARRTFDVAILNPPYHKIRSDSDARHALRSIGVETSNLYTAFLALAIELLEPGGELVAITPRSFCNGPYFRPFRERLLAAMSLSRIHVFERRDKAFRDDAVLQETVIFRAVKQRQSARVTVSSSDGPDDPSPTVREVSFEQVVRPDDPERIFHIVTDSEGDTVAARASTFRCTLADLGLQVSTGRVVDFRAREHLCADPEPGTVPLIHPTHLRHGAIEWPKRGSKKPNAIRANAETSALLLPAGFYVLTKRFSSKEERRRIVASVYDPKAVRGERVGFENHLNVFHEDGHGMPERVARGLSAWLNTTLVDEHFRCWSGHTQVNATDLRKMTWPTRAQLEALGHAVPARPMTQGELDETIERVLFA